MKNIIFIAPPAAGKGTQSKLVSQEYNIPHISTGDLLRDEVATGSVMGKMLESEMNKGGLISDDTMINLLRNRISRVDCNRGYILDGYPRNVEQAKIYDTMMHELGLDVGIVIFMDIDRELALKRTVGRLICSSCGASYNKDVESLKPQMEGICDKCGHILTVRSDDNLETAQVRYDTYMRETAPLVEYYRQKGILRELKIFENDTTEDVFNKVKLLIG